MRLFQKSGRVLADPAAATRADEGNALIACRPSDVTSWYKNAAGRVAHNWPFKLVEFWDLTRKADLADYSFV